MFCLYASNETGQQEIQIVLILFAFCVSCSHVALESCAPGSPGCCCTNVTGQLEIEIVLILCFTFTCCS